MQMTQFEREELKAWAQLAAVKDTAMAVDPQTILALFNYVEAVEAEASRLIEQAEAHAYAEYDRGYNDGFEQSERDYGD